MKQLSVVLITYNEERNIVDCLESVKWADEIVVIDAGSSDRTVETCRKYTDRIYYNPWRGFPKQRNFGLSRLEGEWVLVIDADERVTDQAKDEILRLLTAPGNKQALVYRVPRRNYFFGKWLRWGGAYPDLQIRFFKAGSVVYDEATLDSPVFSGATSVLSAPFDHMTGPTISERIRKINRETEFLARSHLRTKKIVRWYDLMLRPLAAFVKVFLLKQGFRDGMHGFLFASLHSFHAFVRYAKLWELIQKEKTKARV